MAASSSNVEKIRSMSPEEQVFNFFQRDIKQLLTEGYTKQYMKKYCNILVEIYLRMHKMEEFGKKLVKFLDNRQKILRNEAPKMEEKKLDEICERMKTVEYILQEVTIKLNTDISPQLESSINMMRKFRLQKLVAEKSGTITDWYETNKPQKSEQEERKELLTVKQKEDHIKRMIEGFKIQ